MKICERCKRKYLFAYKGSSLCKNCYQIEETLRINREREEENQRLIEKEIKIADAKAAYFRIVDLFKNIKSMSFNTNLDMIRQNLSACEMFDKEFQAFIEMPYVNEVMQAERSPYMQNRVYVDGFGYLPYEVLPDRQAKVGFNEVLEEAKRKANICRIYIKKSGKFNHDLQALHIIEIKIDDDLGEQKHVPLTLLKVDNVTKRSLSKVVNFIAVDVETTGLSPERDEVIELAAIKFVNFQPDEVFHTYIKPRHGLKSEAQKINHITEDMVEDAPYFEQITAAFDDFIGNSLSIVGHNLPFDYRFLTALGGTALVSERKFYDTLDLSKREYDQSKNNLDYLCTSILQIARNNSHSAVSDALATGYLFRDICDRRIGDIYSQFCEV